MRRLTSVLALAMAVGLTAPALAEDQMMSHGTHLYMVDLETGDVQPVGTIGMDETVIGFALDATADVPGHAWAVTTDGSLLTFDVSAPDTIVADVAITGVEDGDWLIGIDQRPATGELFGISAWGVVYAIDPESGEAAAIGEGIDPALESDSVGFDFNPTVDRIRVDVSTTQNLRLNPETGLVGINADTNEPTIDGNLAFAEADASMDAVPMVVGAGYTNSVDGAEETTLYVIDAATNSLAIQDPPNEGTLNTVGMLSEEVNAFTSFDIAPGGEAFLVIPAWDDMASPES